MHQKRENTMMLPKTSKDELDNLVSKLCEETQLMESTIRDLFSHGWEWRVDHFSKHRHVESNRNVGRVGRKVG